MKFYFFLVLCAVFYKKINILANPPKGGISDGYIYPAKQTASKPKATTTYYAKPLYTPMKKHSGPPKPKPEVFKVIIENQNVRKPQSTPREEIYKIIRLPAKQNTNGNGKSVKILKIFHTKQTKVGQKRGWSK